MKTAYYSSKMNVFSAVGNGNVLPNMGVVDLGVGIKAEVCTGGVSPVTT